MVLTTEIVAGVFGGAIVVGGLIWKAAAKLTSIESKVDTAVEWITEQKKVALAAANAPQQPARKRSRR